MSDTTWAGLSQGHPPQGGIQDEVRTADLGGSSEALECLSDEERREMNGESSWCGASGDLREAEAARSGVGETLRLPRGRRRLGAWVRIGPLRRPRARAWSS